MFEDQYEKTWSAGNYQPQIWFQASIQSRPSLTTVRGSGNDTPCLPL